MEELKNRIYSIIDQVTTREHIFPFFSVLSKNLQLSLENNLLVYAQDTNANIVCGKKAWMNMGRSLKKDAASIDILYPLINNKDIFKYEMVRVYSLDQTEGDHIELILNFQLADRITEITGCVWEMVSLDFIDSGGLFAKWDDDRRTFCIANNCPRDLLDQAILGNYIDYLNKNEPIDQLVKNAVLYVLCERWNIKHTIVTALFGRLSRMNIYNKESFLQKVFSLSKNIVEDMEGRTLSFNEVAFINELVCTDDINELERIFLHVARNIRQEEISQDLLELMQKLKGLGDESIKKLIERKNQCTLFSYPLYHIDI